MRRWHWCCNRPDIHRVFRRYRESSGAIQSRTRVRSAGHVAQRPIHQSQYVAGPADPVLSCRRAATGNSIVGVARRVGAKRIGAGPAVDLVFWFLPEVVAVPGWRWFHKIPTHVSRPEIVQVPVLIVVLGEMVSVGGIASNAPSGTPGPLARLITSSVPASPVLVADPPSGGCGFSSMPGDPRSTGCIHSVR